jgi:ElaB/YqjD/DUF883 family membrane-anchored ribosome-binding protein
VNDRDITALEQETENTRTRVSELLDELRGRVSPGEIVDQMVSYAGDGAGEFVRTLGNQLRNNPLPAVLIGVSVAWLMFSDRRPPQAARTARRSHPAADALASGGGEAVETAGRAQARVLGASETLTASAADTTDRASTLSHRAVEAAAELGHRAADSTSALGHRAVDAASQARHSVEDIGKRALSTANHMLHEQPLVAAGIGLAIGAALGAALPSTEAENRLMGSTSDGVKDRARQAAAGPYERAKDAAEDAYGTVADTVAREVSSLSRDDGRHEAAGYHTQDHGPRSPG